MSEDPSNDARIVHGGDEARAAATVDASQHIRLELQGNGSFDLFTLGMITTDEIQQYVSKEPMK